MRRFRRSDRGLSEIVGTLMLVVIVVTAATLLAAFVASYQKQVQTEETLTHDQSLESIQILGLITTVSKGAFTSFSFTLASEYVNPSGILDVYINGNPLLDFAWDNVTTSTSGVYNAVTSTNDLVVQPFDQVVVSTCLALAPSTCPAPGGGSFGPSFLPGDAPIPNSYLKFDIFTHLHNDFSRVYLPPTSIPVVSETNPSGNNPLTLLDGSMSFQSGGNATIVDWGWYATGGAFPVSTSDLINGVTGYTNGAISSGSYIGTATSVFTDPSGSTYGSGYSVELQGTAISDITDSGGCTTTAAWVGGPLTSQVVTQGSPDTISVTYNWAATFTGCTGVGTVAFATPVPPSTGDAGIIVNATGEEYEVSPALPTLSGSETPYAVTLTTTNSVGLEGSVTVEYSPPT